MLEPKILIAGATGTNGQALLKKLNAANIPVRAMVRNNKTAKNLEQTNIQIVEADLSDERSLSTVFVGIDKAYIATSIHPAAVTMFENFFNAAKKAGVKHIVKLSGYGASADSYSEILRQHYQSDQLLINTELYYTIIQPNSFFQNLLWQARSIKTKNTFKLPLANAKQSFIDVRDIAEVAYKAMTEQGHENKIYRLTGGNAVSCYEIANILSNSLDKKITYLPVLPDKAAKQMIAAGTPEWNANALAEIQQDFATGRYACVTDDVSSILARQPISLAQFVQDFKNLF